jgi:hypothetical protein
MHAGTHLGTSQVIKPEAGTKKSKLEGLDFLVLLNGREEQTALELLQYIVGNSEQAPS